MKFFAWIIMSIFVALIISWPLVLLFGASRETVGVLSLIGGAIAVYWPQRATVTPPAGTGKHP